MTPEAHANITGQLIKRVNNQEKLIMRMELCLENLIDSVAHTVAAVSLSKATDSEQAVFCTDAVVWLSDSKDCLQDVSEDETEEKTEEETEAA